jgi:hypothetical protein
VVWGAVKTQKYDAHQHLIQTLPAWVKSREIAIPEIQRPFVWDTSKVRDLMEHYFALTIQFSTRICSMRESSETLSVTMVRSCATSISTAQSNFPLGNFQFRKVQRRCR